MYNTGDIGYMDDQGYIYHMGRLDDQVKIKVKSRWLDGFLHTAFNTALTLFRASELSSKASQLLSLLSKVFPLRQPYLSTMSFGPSIRARVPVIYYRQNSSRARSNFYNHTTQCPPGISMLRRCQRHRKSDEFRPVCPSS